MELFLFKNRPHFSISVDFHTVVSGMGKSLCSFNGNIVIHDTVALMVTPTLLQVLYVFQLHYMYIVN